VDVKRKEKKKKEEKETKKKKKKRKHIVKNVCVCLNIFLWIYFFKMRLQSIKKDLIF
jgi:hypothetical protein